jgi:3-oxoacyl-[acyl-carrier protein] reductase
MRFHLDQQMEPADQVIKSIREAGGKAECWEWDLRHPENVHRLFKEAEKIFKHIDILVNNAAEYAADTFLPMDVIQENAEL